MMWAKFLKPKIWLPIAVGLIIAGVLAVIGENDDAPILTLFGFIAAILLLFYGAYNVAAVSRRSLIVGVLFFTLSAIGIVHTVVLWLEGEYADSPGVGGLIVLISIGLAIVGVRFVRKRK